VHAADSPQFDNPSRQYLRTAEHLRTAGQRLSDFVLSVDVSHHIDLSVNGWHQLENG
jgi:hypothetical protein